MGQTREGAIKTAAKTLGITVENYLERISAGQKRCRKCEIWKPVEEFGKDVSRGDKLKTSCFSCNRVQVKKKRIYGVSLFKGKTHTAESRAKMSRSRIGKQSKYKGVARTKEVRERISDSALKSPNLKRGQEHYAYKNGAKQRNLNVRRSVEYKQWRTLVFERDKYTCQHCGDNRGGNLNAHHKKPFATHPELRLDVDNGITLCEPCHIVEHQKEE